MNSTTGVFLVLNCKATGECFFVHKKNYFKVFYFSLSLKEQILILFYITVYEQLESDPTSKVD